MNAEQFEFLKQITQCYGPSGAEGQVRDLIKERVEKFSTSITVDALGNLIITKGNGGNLVISAHMDEVALTVTGFEEDGTSVKSLRNARKEVQAKGRGCLHIHPSMRACPVMSDSLRAHGL